MLKLEQLAALLEQHRDAAQARVKEFTIGGKPFTREQSWSRFLRHPGLWHHLGFGFFALEDRQTSEFVGEAGFHDMQRNIVPTLDGSMEVGWALTGPMQGRGLAEEAMRAAIGWAQQQSRRPRLTAIIDPGNGASRRVAEKLGFALSTETTYNALPILLFERPL